MSSAAARVRVARSCRCRSRRGIAQLGARVVTVRSPETTAALAVEVGAKFAVVDGYHLGGEYQQDLAAHRRARARDRRSRRERDRRRRRDPQPERDREARALRRSPRRALLGPAYALIRREFRAVARARTLARDRAQRARVVRRRRSCRTSRRSRSSARRRSRASTSASSPVPPTRTRASLQYLPVRARRSRSCPGSRTSPATCGGPSSRSSPPAPRAGSSRRAACR